MFNVIKLLKLVLFNLLSGTPTEHYFYFPTDMIIRSSYALLTVSLLFYNVLLNSVFVAQRNTVTPLASLMLLLLYPAVHIGSACGHSIKFQNHVRITKISAIVSKPRP